MFVVGRREGNRYDIIVLAYVCTLATASDWSFMNGSRQRQQSSLMSYVLYILSYSHSSM